MPNDSNDHARAVLDAIRRIVRAIRVSSRDTERRVGLSAAQLFVLSRLSRHEGLSLNELSEHSLTHQSSTSVVVRKLVERGLVRRSTAVEDRRRHALSLTPAGRKLIARGPVAAQDRLVDGLGRMPPRDVARLATLLNRLVESVGGDASTPAPLIDAPEARRPPRRAKK